MQAKFAETEVLAKTTSILLCNRIINIYFDEIGGQATRYNNNIIDTSHYT